MRRPIAGSAAGADAAWPSTVSGGAAIGDNAYFVGGSLNPGGGGITDQLIMFNLPQ